MMSIIAMLFVIFIMKDPVWLSGPRLALFYILYSGSVSLSEVRQNTTTSPGWCVVWPAEQQGHSPASRPLHVFSWPGCGWPGLIPVNALSSLSPHFISAFSGRVVSEAQRQNILVSETFVFQDGKSLFSFYFSLYICRNYWDSYFHGKYP